ncbi:MAG: hypothetical protein PWP21_191 [Thermosediminibacterales bacterium]|nr:hypothetical protein [Thermosediminibacterales bacterium]
MEKYFADLHIHIGRARGHAVKVTGSRSLTLKNIINECVYRKGINIAGIVDCASPFVLDEIDEMITKKTLKESEGGGLLFKNNLLILLGSEVEIPAGKGNAHCVCYFPYISDMKNFSREIKKYIKNVNLSSQKCYLSPQELLETTNTYNGIFIPAHVFTPHKSFYGSCVDRLSDLFSPIYMNKIFAIELGLSADSYLAQKISETRNKAYLSNSDAHSLSKIAREYNILLLEKLNFQEVVLALRNKTGRKILANYGLDPKLGKYHRTRCMTCGKITHNTPPVKICDFCGSENVVVGVLDRITEIQDAFDSNESSNTPPYYYQVPLEYIPGVGKKTIDKLIKAFGSEMNVLHFVNKSDLVNIVNEIVAENILKARRGKLKIQSGGGGQYGKIEP